MNLAAKVIDTMSVATSIRVLVLSLNKFKSGVTFLFVEIEFRESSARGAPACLKACLVKLCNVHMFLVKINLSVSHYKVDKKNDEITQQIYLTMRRLTPFILQSNIESRDSFIVGAF